MSKPGAQGGRGKIFGRPRKNQTQSGKKNTRNCLTSRKEIPPRAHSVVEKRDWNRKETKKKEGVERKNHAMCQRKTKNDLGGKGKPYFAKPIEKPPKPGRRRVTARGNGTRGEKTSQKETWKKTSAKT